MSDIVSKPYKPDSARCCQACAFASGPHAEFCDKFKGLSLSALKRTTDATMRALLDGARQLLTGRTDS